MYLYTAYGLTLLTPFPCPILPPAPEGATPDVIVSYGKAPRHLPAPTAEGLNWEATSGRYLWRAGLRAGRFLVEGGQQVTVERNPAAEDEMLAFHFLDSVLTAVLRQRGMLVLHGNAALTPSGVVVVSGLSGAGKSTTLAALLARGCTMLADDIAALQLDSAGQVLVLPGIPQLHLTEEAAAGLGRDISGLPRYPWKRMKAAVPASDVMATKPAPLRAIYLLNFHDQDELRLEPLTGGDKFAALQDCVYGPLFPEEHPGLFHLFAAVAEQTAVYRLTRPAETWTVDQIADIILNGQTPLPPTPDSPLTTPWPLLPTSTITWLASYPKSGNTWLRALLTNYQQDGEAPADINRLQGGPIASARIWFDEWSGIEASLLSDQVITRLRPEVYRCMAREADDAGEPLIMKTHDAWGLTDRGDPIFPLDVSAGAIYILRNPLDLAASCAHHWGVSPAEAVENLCDPEHVLARSLDRLDEQLLQRLRDWSGHVLSWLDEAAQEGLAVHLVRYEDLRADPEAVFSRVVHFLGLPFDRARLRKAVAFSDFSELQRQEEATGFRERSVKTSGLFFRHGQAGSWREELPPELVQRLIAAHGEIMQRFGYLDEHGEPI